MASDPTLLMAPDEDIRAAFEWEARQQRMAEYRRTVTRDMVDRMTGLHREYPWLKPGVVQGMAEAGVDPVSQLADGIAQLAAVERSNSPLGWREPGEVARAMELEREQAPGADLPSFPGSEIVGGIGQGLRAGVRGLFTALETPVQEVSRGVSAFGAAAADEDLSFGEAISRTAPSSGRLALDDLFGGEEVDLGSGFFPGGAIERERDSLKRRLTLDGQFVTPGRLVSRLVTEPGSREYNVVSGLVDTAFQFFGDPVAVATLGASKIAQARKVFKPGLGEAVADAFPRLQRLFEAGAVTGVRRTALPDRAARWLDTDSKAQDLVTWLSNQQDYLAIRFTPLGRAIGDKASMALTDASGPSAVRAVLRAELGRTVADILTAASPMSRTASVRRVTRGWRWTHDTPKPGFVSPSRMDEATRILHDYMRNAKLDDETIAKRLMPLARISDPMDAPVALYNAVGDIMGDIAGKITDVRGSEVLGRKLTQWSKNTYEDTRAYAHELVALNNPVLGSTSIKDGKITKLKTPFWLSEAIDEGIGLTDFRDVRRAVSKIGPFLDLPGVSGSILLGEHFMQNIWKPLQLIRAAWTVRVLGDEQARIAATGYDGVFTLHPIRALAWIVGSDHRILKSRGAKDLLGAAMDDADQFARAANMDLARYTGGVPGSAVTGEYRVARADHPDALRGWAAEFRRTSADPVAQKVADGAFEYNGFRGVDGVKEWFWNAPEGINHRKRLSNMRGKEAIFSDRQLADDYIDQAYDILSSRFGDPDLMRAISSGKLGDVRLRSQPDLDAVERGLKGKLSAMPDEVIVPRTRILRDVRSKVADRMDRTVNMMFAGLMGIPTARLSRGPVFKQAYWRTHAPRLLESADPATSQKALAAAEKAGIRGSDLEALRRAASRTPSSPTITSLDDLDELAKGMALEDTMKLLYDVSRRGQALDVLRIVMPFGEAWKEIITTWAKIGVQRPHTVRRFQQLAEGARELDVDGDGQGWFQPDPLTGEEMFTYPGSGLVSKLLFGTDQAGVSFTGTAAGLNLVSASVLPGFGPVVQIPAGLLIPDTPGWDWVQSAVNPFGEPDLESGVLESQLPAWMQRLRTAFDNPDTDHAYGNTVKNVMAVLHETGEWDLSTPEGQRALLDEAKSKAKALMVVRGFAQFVLPTGPAPRFTTEDLEGNSWLAAAMGEEYRRLAFDEGLGQEGAMQALITRFGPDATLWVQSKSRMLQPRPVTTEGDRWIRDNRELVDEFANTIGWFAPDPEFGVFDYDAYQRSFEEGSREALTPKEWLMASQAALGRIAWDRASRVIDETYGRKELADALKRSVKEELTSLYPGFNTWIGTTPRPRIDVLVRELEQAADNSTLAATDAGQGLRVYLDARERALEAAQSLGLVSFSQAAKAAPIRGWLRSVVGDIIREHPGFMVIWEQALSRELAEDEEPLPLEEAV